MNLRLSKRGDYVVRSAICLARAYESGRPTKLREVSTQMGVPRTFASQILGDLVRADLAVSSFGTHGGYRLARHPEAVSLLQVVEAGEGSLAPERCAFSGGPCTRRVVCPLHETWLAAARVLQGVLASSSLATLAEADRRGGEVGRHTFAAPAYAHRSAMPVVAESVEIARAASSVASRLQAGASWLAPQESAARADGVTRARVGPGGPAWLGKTVAIRLGPAGGDDEVLVIPLAWEATGATGLFPRLSGELRLTPLGPDRCELSISGRYRPPFGRAGQVLDEALLTYVARATLRAFLRRAVRSLEERPRQAVREPVPGTEPAGAPG